MIGRTFLMPPQEDGTRLRAKILERVRASREELKANPDLIKFKCKLGETELAEIVAYNDIVDYIEDDQTWDGVWTFEEILAHEGPFRKGHPRHKGSSYNVYVQWSTGEKTWVPIKNILESDPVTLAIYA